MLPVSKRTFSLVLCNPHSFKFLYFGKFLILKFIGKKSLFVLVNVTQIDEHFVLLFHISIRSNPKMSLESTRMFSPDFE